MRPNGTSADNGPELSDHGDFRALIERYENAPNQCTIFPAETEETERMATWITAAEPGFVDLRNVR